MASAALEDDTRDNEGSLVAIKVEAAKENPAYA